MQMFCFVKFVFILAQFFYNVFYNIYKCTRYICVHLACDFEGGEMLFVHIRNEILLDILQNCLVVYYIKLSTF